MKLNKEQQAQINGYLAQGNTSEVIRLLKKFEEGSREENEAERTQVKVNLMNDFRNTVKAFFPDLQKLFGAKKLTLEYTPTSNSLEASFGRKGVGLHGEYDPTAAAAEVTAEASHEEVKTE